MVSPLPLDLGLFSEHAPCLLELSHYNTWKYAQRAGSRVAGGVGLTLWALGVPLDPVGRFLRSGTPRSLWVDFLLHTIPLMPFEKNSYLSLSQSPSPSNSCRSCQSNLSSTEEKWVSPATSHTTGVARHSLTTVLFPHGRSHCYQIDQRHAVFP